MALNSASFIRQLLNNPSQVGAVAPSSRHLAKAMAEGLGASSGHVIEIGPGTGSITRGILETGVDPRNLHLFELNPAFCETLRQKFAGVAVYNQMAQEMTALGLNDVSCVISSLPMLNMPQAIQLEIVTSVFETLMPGGKLVQFTYRSRPPINQTICQQLELRWEKRRTVWANLPPAHVYVCEKALQT
jgi:phosphatidylethanolamine/phosphatidyl-N-methylethanolamine N-methyltransferase